MKMETDIRVKAPSLWARFRMATFYVLPPRASLESALSEVLGRLLPGLPLPADAWDCIADRLGSAGQWPEDVFLVPRDDLPEGENLGESLCAAFGAESGDRVVEICITRAQAAPRIWVLGHADVPSIATAR